MLSYLKGPYFIFVSVIIGGTYSTQYCVIVLVDILETNFFNSWPDGSLVGIIVGPVVTETTVHPYDTTVHPYLNTM
jgi:hypothetical protein